MNIGELIDKLGGQLLCGDRNRVVLGVSDVDLAKKPHLVFGENAESVSRALQSGAGAAIVPLGTPIPIHYELSVVAAKQPRLWFAKAAILMKGSTPFSGIHPTAVIAANVLLGDQVSIGAGASVGFSAIIGARTRIEAGVAIGDKVTIGEDCVVHPGVVIYPSVQLGNRVIVHAGAVLGADGFGYVRDRETGAYTQFPQVGELILEDDVEIGANTTIDRGALRETRIRRGVKIDNLVHIGHHCDIGEDVVMASLTGISGSSTIGKGAILAGQVGVGDHAHIGPGVILGGQAGVLSGKTVNTQGTVLWGTPAKPLREYLRELATLARLARRKKD